MDKKLSWVQPISTPTLNNECYKKIKEMILGGLLPWGERLDVGLLASSFGVSKFPVIKALDRLSQEKLLTISPNRGTYVTTPHEKDVKEVSEIRIMIEKYALKAACGNDIEKLTEKLHAIQENFTSEKNDFSSFLQYDRAFHSAIVESVHNEQLKTYYDSIRTQTELFRTKTFTEGNSNEALSMHKDILKHLDSKDIDGAITALLKHLMQVYKDEISSLEIGQ
ncbi:GntR family transcriptional regulator [uncultured Sphaerochaeta sp.]|uniref:GntR family transcriptional regulator n=1 Tax=uncultured Sphaerochaeta sp. TaxID=886478 RepID=UPI002A0A5C56|nr:GntR family transcriptional regulator [uncultured Sphaerochaeta sp.]